MRDECAGAVNCWLDNHYLSTLSPLKTSIDRMPRDSGGSSRGIFSPKGMNRENAGRLPFDQSLGTSAGFTLRAPAIAMSDFSWTLLPLRTRRTVLGSTLALSARCRMLKFIPSL